MTDIQKWLNLPYPSSVDKQYIFKHDKYYDDRVNMKANGMIIDILNNLVL